MNPFEKAIKVHLDRMASKDAEFANKLEEKVIKAGSADKVVADCCQYILGEVKQSRRQGFTDEEVYGMANHYIDEKNIEIKKSGKCHVVVNQTVELTKEDKERLRKEAEEEFKAQVIKEAKEAKKKEEERAAERAREKKKEEAQRQKEYDEADLLFSFDE